MKPGDHPDFFRRLAPEGRSRESSIRLDARGRWFHDGAPVEHVGLAAALGTWIARHPDDGRYVLSNGYDWCYVTIEATPFFVVSVRALQPVLLRLSDGTEEPLDPRSLRLDEDGVLRCSVKGGADDARFTRHAQLALEPLLVDGHPPAIVVDGVHHPIG